MGYNSISRQPKGYITIASPDRPLQEHDTLRCCHCGQHWRVVPGSGRVRGFCRKCMQVTCGQLECDNCMPIELKVYLYELGKLKVLR